MIPNPLPCPQQAVGPGIHRNPLQPRWAASGAGPQPHGEMLPGALKTGCWVLGVYPKGSPLFLPHSPIPIPK